jgi:prolyl-tRNA synthetase
MLTHQEKLFSKTRKETPTDADSVSHQFMTRGGYVDQLASGIYSMLPLGWQVHHNIEKIIRDEMNKVGGQEVTLPSLQPSSLWSESGRLDKMDPPLFKVADRHKRELVLAPTHEEVMTDLARKYISSYKDLPVALFQIQTKFRNEMRATGGLLRVREFVMKDLYSFHKTEEDLASYYKEVEKAYQRIFKRCDLDIIQSRADSGTIGGSVSHEWQIPSEVGEDKVLVCTSCGDAVNVDAENDKKEDCGNCRTKLEIKSCIEGGHTFQLGTKYSKSMKAYYTTESGGKELIVMGCYGVGVGRLMAAIADTHNDEKGLIWPVNVAPYKVHVLALQSSVVEAAEKVALELAEKTDVLFDNRDISAGQKFAESDLLGMPTRVIVSEKTEKEGKIEVVDRRSGESEMKEVKDLLKSY